LSLPGVVVPEFSVDRMPLLADERVSPPGAAKATTVPKFE
jgi:hypothetical protein